MIPRVRSPLRERAEIALVAFLTRLVLVCIVQPEPVWDGRYFDALARHLARGDGYATAVEGGDGALRFTAHYPVGYPALLSLAYRFFTAHVGVAFVLQALLGAALAWLVHALVGLGGHAKEARRAGLLTALFPSLVLQASLVMAEPLAAVLYALLVLAIIHQHTHRHRALYAAAFAGVVGACATLVRPQTVLIVPVLLGISAYRAQGAAGLWPAKWGRVAVFLAAFAAVVLPWSVRNTRVLDGPAFVSTNGGWNLAIGALPGASGRYRSLPAGHGCEAESGEVRVDRCLQAKALEAIADDPVKWLALIPAKLSYTMDYEAFPVEVLHESRPALVPEGLRKLGWRVLMVLHQGLLLGAAWRVFREQGMVGHRLGAIALALVPMAALGRPTSGGVAVALAGLLMMDRDLVRALIGGTLIVTLATHAVFFGEDRYHMVIEALLVVVLLRPTRRAALK